MMDVLQVPPLMMVFFKYLYWLKQALKALRRIKQLDPAGQRDVAAEASGNGAAGARGGADLGRPN